MFVHHLNPLFLDIGWFQIRYYGLFFAISVLLGVFVVRHFARVKRLSKITDDIVYEFTTYLLIGSLIGARLIFILFNDPLYYVHNPLEIPAVWHGGLAFYGAILGAIIVGHYYSKARKIPFYDLADLYIVPLAFGLFLGRIANFINGEVVGTPTAVSWCVVFPAVDNLCRHPVQLYASLKNLFIFCVLWFASARKHAKGFIFWLFFMLYAPIRFFIEFFRQSDYYVLGLSAGQIASIFVFILSAVMLCRVHKKKH